MIRSAPGRPLRGSAILAVILAGVAACGVSMAAPAAPAPVPPSGDGGLLAPERIAALPAARRAEWERYLAASERQREIDRRSIEAELESLGRESRTPAPDARGRVLREPKPDEWFTAEEARRIAEAVLSYQTPAGGWSKNLDYRQGPRQPGQSYYSSDSWSYIGTFDNDATTDEMRFLARVHAAQRDVRFRDAFSDGLEYIFRAQYPSGCWPQVYPLQGGYHDAATYNDEAIPNILQLLREVGQGEFPWVPEPTRRRADAAVRHGIECILATQVVVDGRRTVWGQQHDPLSLEPVSGPRLRARGADGRRERRRRGVPDAAGIAGRPRDRCRPRRGRLVPCDRDPRLRVSPAPPDRTRRRRPDLGSLLRDRYQPPDLQQPRRRSPL